MVEFEYYEDLECKERENEIVQKLLMLNFGIYGKQIKTTLDGISVGAEKKLNSTKVRVANFKILFQEEGNTDENRLSVAPSASNQIPPSEKEKLEKRKENMEKLTVIENTTSVSNSQHALAGKKDDSRNKGLPEFEENTSHALSGSVGNPSMKTTLDASPSSTPTTAHGCKKITLDVSLPNLQKSEHGDTREDRAPDNTSGTYITTETQNKEVQTASCVEGKDAEPVPDGLNKGSEVETILVSDEQSEMKYTDSNLENKFHSHSRFGVKNEGSDTEDCHKYSSLKSSGSCQHTEDLHLSADNAISTHVSIAGCLPESEERRPRFENCIEIVDSLEQLSHAPAPSTSIIEDRKKVGSEEGFRNKIESEDMQKNRKCKPKKKSKEKKKAKVYKKEKSRKDGETEKTKSTKFRRRLVSLFCCCFASQERNDEKNKTEQSTTKNRSYCEDTSQRHSSFVTIDLNI